MILTDNIMVLKRVNSKVFDMIQENDRERFEESIEEVQTKSGFPSLQLSTKEVAGLIHSKYDPVQEAERFISQFDKVAEYKQVFFFGVGLGYHLEAFFDKYPNMPFTLYEPKPTIFQKYLTHRSLKKLPLAMLKNIYLGSDSKDIASYVTSIVNELDSRTLIICLPSYKRLFAEEYTNFVEAFQKAVEEKKQSIYTNLAFEKRWTVNSLVNMTQVRNTPNILLDIKKELFANKPAILVAAGPSLEEEIENLRYIKENGLAYIFAVGSANKALLRHEIYPDAVCSYDPQAHNYQVYNEIISQHIVEIPLIFGSSVGFETVEKYPGKKLHFITMQDTASPYYLKPNNSSGLETIRDATTISTITLQILTKLGANPIILVGQNLAFKNDQFYAQGISYEGRSASLSEREKEAAFIVKAVDGSDVSTSKGFNRMREEMETYIKAYSNLKVINTTAGGAHIEGTEYISLDKVIKEYLTEHKIIETNWFPEQYGGYDLEYGKQQQRKMNLSYKEINALTNRLSKTLKNVETQIKSFDEKAIIKSFNKIDREFKKIRKNGFFKVFILPMIRVQLELFSTQVRSAQFERHELKRAKEIYQAYSSIVNTIKENVELITPYFQKLDGEMMDKQ